MKDESGGEEEDHYYYIQLHSGQVNRKGIEREREGDGLQAWLAVRSILEREGKTSSFLCNKKGSQRQDRKKLVWKWENKKRRRKEKVVDFSLFIHDFRSWHKFYYKWIEGRGMFEDVYEDNWANENDEKKNHIYVLFLSILIIVFRQEKTLNTLFLSIFPSHFLCLTVFWISLSLSCHFYREHY